MKHVPRFRNGIPQIGVPTETFQTRLSISPGAGWTGELGKCTG